MKQQEIMLNTLHNKEVRMNELEANELGDNHDKFCY